MNRHTISRAGLVALASGVLVASCTDDAQEVEVDCRAEQARVLVTAVPGGVRTDGAVTIYGTIRFAPLYGLDGEGGGDAGAGGVQPFERTVRAVYVGTVAATTDFNFRSWSALVPGDVLTAYRGDDGKARLPVDAYIYGGCVVQLPEDQRPAIDVPEGGGGRGGAGGDGGGAGNGGAAGNAGAAGQGGGAGAGGAGGGGMGGGGGAGGS
jgi:hypothetical protein